MKVKLSNSEMRQRILSDFWNKLNYKVCRAFHIGCTNCSQFKACIRYNSQPWFKFDFSKF